MTCLGAFTQMHIFQLNKVTHMCPGLQYRTRTNTGERAGIAAFSEYRAFDMAIGLDHHALAQGTVLDHAVRTDHDVVFDDDLAFEDHVDINQHVPTDGHFTAHIKTCRVSQRHTLGHQTATRAQLIMTLQLGELLAIVGTLHFHCIVRLFGRHHETIADRHGDHVGQVVLALGIVVGETAHPLPQFCERQGQDAGVAFGDRSFGFVGVFLLDDGRHLASGVAHDTAVAGRIVQFNGEQAQLLRRDFREQALECFDLNERHVTVENQDSVGFDERYGLGHGMAGAELLVLKDKIQIIGGQAFTHCFSAMADHDVNALGLKLPGAVDNMSEHRVSGNWMQDFW
ncbi:hypothetical protein D3C84_641990 [compost metagenome]